MSGFVDTHVHLAGLTSAEIPFFLHKCSKAGARELWLPGTSLADSVQNQKLAVMHSSAQLSLSPFAGLHPFNAATFSEKAWLDFFMESQLGVIGIGEIGLDKRCEISLSVQLQALEFFLDYAFEKHLPVLIHCVGAHNELLHLMKRRRSRIPRGIIHGASCSVETAQAYIRHGFLIGLGAVAMNDGARRIYQAMASLPLSSFVTETDWPYMRNPDVLSRQTHQAEDCNSVEKKSASDATDSGCAVKEMSAVNGASGNGVSGENGVSGSDEMFAPWNLPELIRKIASMRAVDEDELASLLVATASGLKSGNNQIKNKEQ